MTEPAAFTNTCPNAFQGVQAYLFLSLINGLIESHCRLAPEGKYPPDYAPRLQNGSTFDFIVVGGGTAGSVLANRLTEDQNWNVLVVEAGGYPSAMSEVPPFLFNLRGTDEDWQYVSETGERGCSGLKEGVCMFPRGKVLGGSSTINAMLHVRGNRRDYDRWAESGNAGWDYEGVLRYFHASESLKTPDGGSYFGSHGQVPLTVDVSMHPVREGIKRAYTELGYAQEGSLGYYDVPSAIYEGVRQNAAKVYLGSVKHRKNLHVALNVRALNVLVDDSGKAKGVRIKIGDKTLEIEATKEVILSAGAFNTPLILMHSGIGPKRTLERLGIKVLKDLPVGQNLQDHLMFLGLYTTVSPSAIARIPEDGLDEFYKYLTRRTGRFAHTDITNFNGFVNTNNDSRYPNLQMFHTVTQQKDVFALPHLINTFGIDGAPAAVQLEVNRDADTMCVYPILLNPKSRGEVVPKSSDPLDGPVIRPKYLTDVGGEDLEALLRGVEYVRKLYKTESLKPYGPKLVDLKLVECHGRTFDSEEYWKCAIENFSTGLYHPVGTCKMGPEGDVSAVVDDSLKVHGVRNLRVVDASIMPEIVSGNTNSAAMMIGEKGADLIKEVWKASNLRQEL